MVGPKEEWEWGRRRWECWAERGQGVGPKVRSSEKLYGLWLFIPVLPSYINRILIVKLGRIEDLRKVHRKN